MINSIVEDIKGAFRYGNMISRIIIINVAVYIIINLIKVFTFYTGGEDSLYSLLIRNLAIPAEFSDFIWKPWTLVTHMFLHEGFFHILWNMLLLFWFGRIVGDFLGDRKVIPLYIMGGIFGGIVYMVTMSSGYALGASAAVIAFVIAAAVTSPDYIFHLILIGPVKIKYIALAIVLMDIFGTAGQINTGGHFAHLGGAFFGWFFVYMLQQGVDLSEPFANVQIKNKKSKQKKSPLKVYHKSDRYKKASADHKSDQAPIPFQEKLDHILDKIKQSGYDNLTEEEKEFLYQASKKD